ncbi:ribosome biogenesis protein wdr12 homolog [Phtheirospermum japonicum]|uniref:Ribosome biogenesis protein wdr12 homolog n=1 Tax=Phtheirospermum japonicum TaxID=374723 RepID=A0A830C4Z1_9LAMI|nr:ribosome biogenesis protein wdr12 homolog [Phtheirospermum japonicum]
MDIDEIEGADDLSSRQVQVRFITKLKPPYKVAHASISIPANLTRFGLSALVNNLLQAANEDWESEPFDFLIDGELFRMSLEEFLLAKSISAEKVLEIEYFKAVAPRKEEEPSLHDDWVSAVDGSNDGYILTGSYDGFGRIWRAAGICTHALDGHSGPVTSVCNVTPKGESSVDQIVATASKDRTLRLWKFGVEESLNQTKKIRAFKILKGHTASVQSIAAEPLGEMGEALTTLVGHTQCVSSVAWPECRTIYSASWDHSIKRWDVETGKDSLSIFCGKAVNCLDIGGESSALIAVGGSDPVIRIWDPRKPVMLWDLRTAWPLTVIDPHNDKVLCADWWKNDSVISGGADSKLHISSGIPVQ